MSSEGVDDLIDIQKSVTEQFCTSLFANVTQLLSLIAYYEQIKEQPLRFLIENRWIPWSEESKFWLFTRYSDLARKESERRSKLATELLQSLLKSAGIVYYHLESLSGLQSIEKKQQWLYQHLHIIYHCLYAVQHCHSISHFCEMTSVHSKDSLDSFLSQGFSFQETVERVSEIYHRIPLLDSSLRNLYAPLEKPGFLYRKVLYPLIHYTCFIVPFLRFFPHRWLGDKTWIEIYQDGKNMFMSIISFLKQHMIDPLSCIYQELFHNRYMSTDVSTVEQSREAVLRMVESLVSYPIPKNVSICPYSIP